MNEGFVIDLGDAKVETKGIHLEGCDEDGDIPGTYLTPEPQCS